MSIHGRRVLMVVVTVAIGASSITAGCSRRTDPAGLSPGEAALVSLYVQLAVLERLHAERPDSVAAVLDSLRAAHDSLAVNATLRQLEASPERWETVFTEIDARLQALQADEWHVDAEADTLGGAIRVPRDTLGTHR